MQKKLEILCSLLLLTACNGPKLTPPWDYMPNMMDSPAVKAQREVMRIPPPGALPLGFEPYPFKKDEGEKAGQELKNPLPRTSEVFLKGQKIYNNTCIVCHGPRGEGDGSVVPKFPRPPSLNSDKVRNWPDGRIYHVITMGQNLMSSYATQIKPEDRWALTLYLRVLQRAARPTPQDVEAAKKVLQEGNL